MSLISVIGWFEHESHINGSIRLYNAWYDNKSAWNASAKFMELVWFLWNNVQASAGVAKDGFDSWCEFDCRNTLGKDVKW